MLFSYGQVISTWMLGILKVLAGSREGCLTVPLPSPWASWGVAGLWQDLGGPQSPPHTVKSPILLMQSTFHAFYSIGEAGRVCCGGPRPCQRLAKPSHVVRTPKVQHCKGERPRQVSQWWVLTPRLGNPALWWLQAMIFILLPTLLTETKNIPRERCVHSFLVSERGVWCSLILGLFT